MSDEAPKSAIELAMERLKKKDAEAGVQDVPLTEEKKQAIAELRRVYEARLAEREILFQSALRKVSDPEAAQVLDEEYRRDRDRINGERERKIEELRKNR
jgi:hypothetical protein